MTLTQASPRALHTRLLEAARQDAVESGVPPTLAWSVAALPFVGGFLIAATYFHWPLFIWILREDHPVEWGQFALCMITSVVAAMAASRYARRGQWLIAVVFLLLSLGSFILAAEEISWGQRAFAFATPEELKAKNDQEEFNVHNLTEGGVDIAQLFKVVELFMALGGMVLPFLTRLKPPRLRSPLFVALAPPLFLVPLFAFAFAYRLLRFGLEVIGKTPDAAVAFTEWAEAGLYLGLAGLAVFSYASTRERIRGRHVHRNATGEPLPSFPLSPGIIVVTVGIMVMTLILAIMTVRSGILPGNVG